MTLYGSLLDKVSWPGPANEVFVVSVKSANVVAKVKGLLNNKPSANKVLIGKAFIVTPKQINNKVT
jgi:hypothetical protein